MTGEGGSQPSLKRLGAYELIRPIAQGGMADIYLAKKDGIGKFERHVAVKVLNPSRAVEQESTAMFLDEARIVAMLNHQNIASILEVDVVDGHHYLAMEYVHGADLRELLSTAARAGRAVPFEVSLSIVAAACAGLDHAHSRCAPDGHPLELVHRDVSLSNIMVGHDGSVKVVDFGIASTAVQTVHTSPGVVRGKASYMSPEQCLGDRVDLRTDVFALGIVLYELTTGARCFSGKSDFERMLAVVRSEYHAPSAIVANYPPELEVVVRTALASDPARRYPSCTALLEALEHVARARDYKLGSVAIARFMKKLYGKVTEPWAMPEAPDYAAIASSASCATMAMPSLLAEPTAREAPSARRAIIEAASLLDGETIKTDSLADMQVADIEAVAVDESAIVAEESIAPTRRRLAQGTNADGYVRTQPVGEVDLDDQPTRGNRRSLRRIIAA